MKRCHFPAKIEQTRSTHRIYNNCKSGTFQSILRGKSNKLRIDEQKHTLGRAAKLRQTN